jgi:hypothetical protein
MGRGGSAVAFPQKKKVVVACIVKFLEVHIKRTGHGQPNAMFCTFMALNPNCMAIKRQAESADWCNAGYQTQTMCIT